MAKYNWKEMNGKRVLVIDDEDDMTTTFRIILEMEGFKVDTFNDPLLALSRFKPNHYDLVLLDIIMPNIDGFKIYDEIKKIDTEIKILFLTANEIYYSKRKREIYNMFGRDLFLQKPIENEELVKKINDILEKE